jgi:hypothetical protein
MSSSGGWVGYSVTRPRYSIYPTLPPLAQADQVWRMMIRSIPLIRSDSQQLPLLSPPTDQEDVQFYAIALYKCRLSRRRSSRQGRRVFTHLYLAILIRIIRRWDCPPRHIRWAASVNTYLSSHASIHQGYTTRQQVNTPHRLAPFRWSHP